MKSKILGTTVLLTLLSGASCDSPREKVVSEKAQATQKIGEAQIGVEDAREDAVDRIRNAEGSDVEDEKIRATKEIAEAKHEVADEKVEATENITEAETNAEKEPAPALP